jgi:phosphate/sulfate permease
MALMGSTAIGAAVWGQVATVVDVHVSLACAAVWAAVGVALTVLRMPHTPPRV